ncbi:hypothetical protein ACFX15_018440 [Malus domestica]
MVKVRLEVEEKRKRQARRIMEVIEVGMAKRLRAKKDEDKEKKHENLLQKLHRSNGSPSSKPKHPVQSKKPEPSSSPTQPVRTRQLQPMTRSCRH